MILTLVVIGNPSRNMKIHMTIVNAIFFGSLNFLKSKLPSPRTGNSSVRPLVIVSTIAN